MKILLILIFVCFISLNSFAQNKVTCNQWKGDIDYMKIMIEKRHANLYHTISKKQFQTSLDKLRAEVCKLSDEEITVRLSEIIASVRDGHTFLDFRNQPQWKFKSLPIHVEYFDDGLFVTGADAQLKNLLTKQIVAINSIPIEKIIEKTRNVGYRENESTELLSIPRFIIYPMVLRHFQFINNTGQVVITVKSKGGAQENISLIPKLDKDLSWVEFKDTQADLPLMFQQNKAIYWFKYLPKEKVLYLQFNSHQEDETHNFKKLTQQLITEIDTNKPEKLVVDISNNYGGNSRLTFPLISALTYFENKISGGQIFVITSRNTYSASMVFASEVQRFTNAIFIGEPTGVAPNLYTEAGYPLTLPNSKLEIHCSSMFFQSNPFVHSKWIAPNIAVRYKSTDYFALKQPIIDEILNYSPPPKSIYQVIYEYAANDQIDKALAAYQTFKTDYRNKYVDTEVEIRRTATKIANLGKTENARLIYELNVRDYPDRATTFVNLGELYKESKQNKKALEYYLKAQRIIPVDKSINEDFRYRLTDLVEEKLVLLKKSM